MAGSLKPRLAWNILFSLGWPRHMIIALPQPPKFWNDECEPPLPVFPSDLFLVLSTEFGALSRRVTGELELGRVPIM